MTFRLNGNHIYETNEARRAFNISLLLFFVVDIVARTTVATKKRRFMTLNLYQFFKM